MAKNLKEYAKKYAEKGFYVLPMDDKSKRPLIKFADQPPLTVAEIEELWTTYPHAQIALRTVDFLVVDIDLHEDVDGFKSLREYKNVTLFPETLTQTTGSGGRQMFFTKPKGVDITQKIGWLEGVDIKAHENNYVMVAPSQIVGKQPYKWNNHNPIAELPQQIINDINADTPKAHDLGSINYSVGYKKYTGALLDKMVAGAEAGQRNDFLTQVAGSMLSVGAEPETVYSLLNLINQNYISPALSNKEIEKIFSSILTTELRKLSKGGVKNG
ncbi:bifunctional DNA primase/polymerase [Holzapfeliella sp. JNUCC 72]